MCLRDRCKIDGHQTAATVCRRRLAQHTNGQGLAVGQGEGGGLAGMQAQRGADRHLCAGKQGGARIGHGQHTLPRPYGFALFTLSRDDLSLIHI